MDIIPKTTLKLSKDCENGELIRIARLKLGLCIYLWDEQSKQRILVELFRPQNGFVPTVSPIMTLEDVISFGSSYQFSFDVADMQSVFHEDSYRTAGELVVGKSTYLVLKHRYEQHGGLIFYDIVNRCIEVDDPCSQYFVRKWKLEMPANSNERLALVKWPEKE